MASKNEPFGRQLKPVTVTIEGDLEDRDYWAQQICAFLAHRSCVVSPRPISMLGRSFRIYPDANND